jgi:LPS export ABC transporter protein LptC
MIRRSMHVVAAVALALVACRDAQSPPVAAQPLLPDSAEQMFFRAHLVLTDNGVRRADVRADTALAYDANTRYELFRVTTTFYSAEGAQDAILTSDRGSHLLRTGAMEARGHVVVVSSDGRTLESPHLKFDPSRNEISSDSAFTLTEGERVTRGIGFVSNPEMTNMRILRGAQMSGTEVTIPPR